MTEPYMFGGSFKLLARLRQRRKRENSNSIRARTNLVVIITWRCDLLTCSELWFRHKSATGRPKKEEISDVGAANECACGVLIDVAHVSSS